MANSSLNNHHDNYDSRYRTRKQSQYKRFLEADIKSKEWEVISQNPSMWLRLASENGRDKID